MTPWLALYNVDLLFLIIKMCLSNKGQLFLDAYIYMKASNFFKSQLGDNWFLEIVLLDICQNHILYTELSHAKLCFQEAACVLVPGGFGDRGVAGMILAAKYARENHVPYFGICLGMQISVIEFARSVSYYCIITH